MRITISLLVLGAFACSPASESTEPASQSTAGGEAAETSGPDVVGEEVSYEGGGVTLKGYLAYDRDQEGTRPGVIVVHEWWGHNEYVRERARKLAALGYTALAIDMYGDGKNTQHPADAKKFMEAAMQDPAAAKARFQAGMALLQAHPTTDPERTAAIGYCFGGAVVLTMARAGVDLDAVASFHGALGIQAPAEPGAVSAEVLVMTGAADPMVPPEAVAAFDKDMREAGADYEIVSYPGAVHAFTNPGATELGKAHGLPLAYDAAADEDSWERMKALFAEVFAKPEPTAEEKQQAAAARKNRADIARMEAEAAQEAARFTGELRAQAGALAETAFNNTRAALKKILASPHRMPGNPERDVYRHPAQTLAFFGVKPNMTVFEYGPGAGWYTELLAPLLAARGKLIVNNGDPNGSRESRGTYYAKRFQLFLDKAPELYGKVEVVRTDDPAKPNLGMAEELDMALVIRGYHGWKRRGIAGVWLAEIHDALEPKGILGIVQHRAAEGTDPMEAAAQGRMPQKALIEEVEAAGFKLVAKSEVNANPKDTRDQPAGVWTLPPTLRLGEEDRDKYLAIGESDRMTLKFIKVERPEPDPSKPAADASAAPVSGQ
jgi:predicted methyltransferase/dienelactone hydrolase